MAEEAKRLIRFNFKSYLADEDRLYDTNIVDAAKEAGIYDEKALYEPVAHILGTNRLFADLEAALASAEIGKECEVTIPCEKAAGARNPKNVEYYPLKDFVNKEKQQYPQPGMTVTVGNKSGTIASVGAGRVKVDFNSPLAGHDLTYKFTVVEEVTEPLEKAKAVVEADFSTAADPVPVTLKLDGATLRTGDTSYVDELKKMASSLSSINAMYEIQMQNSTSQLEATKEVQERMQSMVANFAESAEGVLKYKEQVDALTRKVAELNNVYGNMLAAMQTRI